MRFCLLILPLLAIQLLAGPVTEHNAPTVSEVDRRIQAALRAHRKPVLFFDLDGTLHNDASRYLALLREYDRTHGTGYFDGLRPLDVPNANLDAFLEKRVPPQSLAAVRQYVASNQWNDGFHRAQQGEPVLIEQVKHWHEMGAEIVYVTARLPEQEALTRRQFEAQGLPQGPILTKDRKGTSAEVKVARLREYRKANPDGDWVAFFDNDQRNIDAVTAAFPEVLGVDVDSRPNVPANRFETFLSTRLAPPFCHGLGDLAKSAAVIYR